MKALLTAESVRHEFTQALGPKVSVCYSNADFIYLQEANHY